MDHRKVAERVIKDVGRDNIIAGAHCATRLRLVLKDDSKVDQKALDNDPDVKGTFKTNGQYQVIIGPGDVNDVYDEFIKITGLKELSTDDLKKVAAEGQKKNPIMDFIKLLSDIFVPIIPALVAGGLLMALNNFLTSPGLFGPKSVVQMVPNVELDKSVRGKIIWSKTLTPDVIEYGAHDVKYLEKIKEGQEEKLAEKGLTVAIK